MKKTALFVLAAGALAFTACSNSHASNASAVAGAKDKGHDKEVLYSGILPAADADGILYTLKLDFDDDHNYTDGDYIMIDNTLVADTTEVSGIKATAVSYYEGDFVKKTRQVNGATVEYLVLTPDAKDLMGAADNHPIYMIVNADESLTVVNSDLDMPAVPELYTLKVQ